MSESLLDVRGLEVEFEAPEGSVRAVRGLDLALAPGQTLGLVGESGAGKSATAHALARLLPQTARVDAARLSVCGRDVLALDEAGLCLLRGRELGMVFQDPGASLDPLMRVGPQVAEGPRLVLGLEAAAASAVAIELFERLGLPDPRAAWWRFPHQLSGGQRQRVGLALALAGAPRLLVADEPTSSLDTTLQAQVLELLRREVQGRGMGLLLVSHDLAVVAALCAELAVLYAGRIVERGPTRELLARPRHPYTRALLRSRPERAPRGARLEPIPGAPADPSRLPPGCAFAERCPLAVARCVEVDPGLDPLPESPGRASACHRALEVPAP